MHVQQLKGGPHGLGDAGDGHGPVDAQELNLRQPTLFKHVGKSPVRVHLDCVVELANSAEDEGLYPVSESRSVSLNTISNT